MPRYYFHFMWSDDAVRDTQGVELEGFTGPIGMRVGTPRVSVFDADEDWWIEVSDDQNGKPTVILPAMVTMPLGRRWKS
jgi:hypothetical protein